MACAGTRCDVRCASSYSCFEGVDNRARTATIACGGYNSCYWGARCDGGTCDIACNANGCNLEVCCRATTCTGTPNTCL
jgi:hypothetical protein